MHHFVGKEQYYYNDSFSSPMLLCQAGYRAVSLSHGHLVQLLYSGLLSKMLEQAIPTTVCIPLRSTSWGQKLNGKEPGRNETAIRTAAKLLHRGKWWAEGEWQWSCLNWHRNMQGEILRSQNNLEIHSPNCGDFSSLHVKYWQIRKIVKQNGSQIFFKAKSTKFF